MPLDVHRTQTNISFYVIFVDINFYTSEFYSLGINTDTHALIQILQYLSWNVMQSVIVARVRPIQSHNLMLAHKYVYIDVQSDKSLLLLRTHEIWVALR